MFGSDFDPTKYRMLLFGFAMVLIAVWKPRGLITTRDPSVRLDWPRRGGARGRSGDRAGEGAARARGRG